MSDVMGKMYSDFHAAFARKHYQLSKQEAQKQCNAVWRDAKKSFSKDSFPTHIQKLTLDYLQAASAEEIRRRLLFFPQVAKRPRLDSVPLEPEATTSSACNLASGSSESGEIQESVDAVACVDIDDISDDESFGLQNKGRVRVGHIVDTDDESDNPSDASCTVNQSSAQQYSKPKQEKLQQEINVLNAEMTLLVTKRDAGLGAEGLDKTITKVRKDIDKKTKELKDKVQRAARQKKLRLKQRLQLQKVREQIPGAAELLKMKDDRGRPRLESDQPGLLKAICDIATHGGSAADRRRSEAIRACKTLHELRDALVDLGYTISKSATYLRLVPRNSASIEGKRHVVTVPVRLCRAQADHHREHPDQHFCRATINGLEELASILGPTQVAIISQDDKAKVPLGMTAAKAQAPILMHLEYKVRLPDHDWAVGSRHKLTPSVYAGITIKENYMGRREAVGYSGPTFIAIRSGKHSSSTASSHAADFERLVTHENFQSLLKDGQGKVKPVLMLSVDGGPDENPRYKKVIAHAISHFKAYNLDAIFIFTNAPGRSAFNRVERRMAPLSRALSGVILPHDQFGTHLDNNGNTVDKDLELKNFQFAGEALADIWSDMQIDGHEVSAVFIPPGENLPEPVQVSDTWYANHVRESQYLLQVIKCDDGSCCSPRRSNLKQILYQRFLPAPYPLDQNHFHIPPPAEHKEEKFPSLILRQALAIRPEYPQTMEIPYDLYCASQRDSVKDRICQVCGIYFGTKVSLDNHKSTHAKRLLSTSRVTPLQVLSKRPGELLCATSDNSLEWIDVESVESPESYDFSDGPETPMPLIQDISAWIEEGNPFVEDLRTEDNNND